MSRGDEGRDRMIHAVTDVSLAHAGAGELFRRGWWAIALRGVAAVVLGIVMLSWPGLTLALFISIIGVYFFIDGLFTLGAAFTAAHRGRSWGPYVLEGLLSVAICILAFARPTSAALFVVLLIAARAIIVGAVELGTGVSVRKATGHAPWLLWLGGLVSVAFGVLLFSRPALGLLALVWTAGIYIIIFGVLMDAEAFHMRSVARGMTAPHAT